MCCDRIAVDAMKTKDLGATLMLKRAVAADVDLVVGFESQVMNEKLYGKPLDRAAATSEIGINHYYLHLANGRVIATGALRWREDGSTYLSNIAVHPEERRKGFANAMMRHLLSMCDRAPSIDLAVHPDNQAARALYVSLSFTLTHIHGNFFGDGEPRMIMQYVRPTKVQDG
jgi:ribosomal protein S18 acetylase RimI-like enzyme